MRRNLEVHERFSGASGGGSQSAQPTPLVTASPDQGMDDQMDHRVFIVDCGGHRIDQEGHVVVDNLDHGVVGRPVVLLQARIIDSDLGFAGLAPARQRPMGERRAQQVFKATLDHVAGWHVFIIKTDEPLDGPVATPAAVRSGLGDDFLDQLGLAPLQLLQHPSPPSSRPGSIAVSLKLSHKIRALNTALSSLLNLN